MITAVATLGFLVSVGATWYLALQLKETIERRQQQAFLKGAMASHLRTRMATAPVTVATVGVETEIGRFEMNRSSAARPMPISYHMMGAV